MRFFLGTHRLKWLRENDPYAQRRHSSPLHPNRTERNTVMGTPKSNLNKLAKLQEEFDAANGSVISPAGGRNRDALIRLSEVAGQMARIHEEEAAEMRRVAGQAHDLAHGK
jgi:hypothetical protein